MSCTARVDLSWRNISTQVTQGGSHRRTGSELAPAIQAPAWTTMRSAATRVEQGAVIHELTTLAAKGELLNSKDAQAAHIELFAAAIRRFASWDEALKAAASTEEIRLRRPSANPASAAPESQSRPCLCPRRQDKGPIPPPSVREAAPATNRVAPSTYHYI